MDQFVEGKSPYEIMGVDRAATAQEIKKVRPCILACVRVWLLGVQLTETG